MSNSWMVGQGHNAAENVVETPRSTKRFWMPPGTTKSKVVFLDDNPPVFHEHQVKIGSSYRNWATCTHDNTCPMCNIGHHPSAVAVYTILDRDKFTYEGKEYSDQIRVFVAKGPTMKKLAARSSKYRTGEHPNGLAGLVFEITRSGDKKSASTGDNTELVGRASETLMATHTPSIVNYADVYAPNLTLLQDYANRTSGGAVPAAPPVTYQQPAQAAQNVPPPAADDSDIPF